VNNNNEKDLKPKKTKNKKTYKQKKVDLDYYTVKIPIMNDFLTDKKLMQLDTIVKQDMKVIKLCFLFYNLNFVVPG